MTTVALVPPPTPAPTFETWTKEMAKHARHATRVFFAFEARPTEGASWEPHAVTMTFVYEEHKEKGRPYRPEQKFSFNVNGFIRPGYYDELHVSTDQLGTMHSYASEDSNRYKPASGSWHFSFYHSQGTHEATAMSMIPVGAEVKFEVKLDAHSNGSLAKVRIHADVFAAAFKRKGAKVWSTLEIDHSIGPHNTARFGYSVNLRG